MCKFTTFFVSILLLRDIWVVCSSGYYKLGCYKHGGARVFGYGRASLGYMSRSGITCSSGGTISNFLRNCQTDFQSCFTSLQFHQQWRSVPLSPHLHLLSPEFFILAILTGMRWNLSIVLICISLVTKDVEHFFRCFSALRITSIEDFLFSSVPHF